MLRNMLRNILRNVLRNMLRNMLHNVLRKPLPLNPLLLNVFSALKSFSKSRMVWNPGKNTNIAPSTPA